jgi:diguanylate cyclase (GGDEF)-like protein/PAS domain S-box-containing protein
VSGMPSWLGAIVQRAVAASTKLTDIAARLFGGASRRFRHEDLEAREAWFATVVDGLSQGLVVFDKDRRVVLCNARYREIYGMEADQVAPGTPTSQLIKRRLELGLKVPDNPEEYVRRRITNEVTASNDIQEFADGRVIAYAIRPMPDGGGVATHEDITERERLHAELAEQYRLVKQQKLELSIRNLQFDAALNNMSQGLCFFDGAQRLIVCNRRYTEMYGLGPDSVRPGTTLREIIDLRCEAGSGPLMTREEYHAWRNRVAVSDKPTDSVVELANGCIFEIHHRPMPDGGWVATHRDITEQRRAEAKIVHMARHDALTGLPNRLQFGERLAQALTRIEPGKVVAVHLFDLDRFKIVNDTLGHSVGDKLLQMAADRLRSIKRDTDTIARMGGDEFAIVQVGLTDATDAAALAHRIIARLSEPYAIDGHQAVIGASVGISIGQDGSATPDQLVRNADLALYGAKTDGRGTVRFFEAEMHAQVKERLNLEQSLRNALASREFELHYQPLIHLATNAITGFEALIRWHHRDKGLLGPDAFIPLAEEIGLINPIGEWVMREACTTAAKWPNHLRIAVNLSPVQVRSSGLVRCITQALAMSGLSPDRLELEITERTLLEDSEAMLAILYQLRELGVCVAIADFGTGRSSLNYLQGFPFDRIKIDRSFVKDIAESTGSLNIVRAVTALAKGLGMAATAEGVETMEQQSMVASEGCGEMQGFLFSKALPAHEIEQLLFSLHGRQKEAGNQSAA